MSPTTITTETGEDMKVDRGEPHARHLLSALLEEKATFLVAKPGEEEYRRSMTYVREFLVERASFVEAAFAAERDRAKEADDPYNKMTPYEAVLSELLSTAPEGMFHKHEPALYPVDAKYRKAET